MANPQLEIAATSIEKERSDVFYRGTDGVLHSASFSGGAWTDKHISVVKMESAPCAISHAESGRIDVFYHSDEGHLINTWHKKDKESWVNTTLPGEKVFSAPKAARGVAPDRIDVIWREKGGDIHDTCFENGSWTTKKIDNHDECASDIYPVAGFEQGRLDCFWRGKDNNLHHTKFHNGWASNKITQHGTMQGAPAPALVGDHLHVYWIDEAHNIHQTIFERAGEWHDKTIGGAGMVHCSVLSVVVGYEANRIDVLWTSKSEHIYSSCFLGGAWKDYQIGGGAEAHGNAGQLSVAGLIGVIPAQFDVFWRHKNGHIWSTTYVGQWQDKLIH